MSISRCRYFWCSKCKTVYRKELQLDSWKSYLDLSYDNLVIMGTRTCKCGNVIPVAEICEGIHDLPRKYWKQVEPPVEL